MSSRNDSVPLTNNTRRPKSRKTNNVQQCSCGILVSIRQQNDHMRGKRHTRAVQALQAIAQNANPTCTSKPVGRDYDDFTHCETCDRDIPSFRWSFHLDHVEHQQTQRLLGTRTALNQIENDKNGIKVSGETAGIDFGVIETEKTLGSSSVQCQVVKIRNTDNNARINLTDLRITSLAHNNAPASRYDSFSCFRVLNNWIFV
jgi:hypothetical protein